MSENITTYSIATSGSILDGHNIENVAEKFASLFKITPDKATEIINGKKVIKKGLDRATARAYQKKLEGIGVSILLNEIFPDEQPSVPMRTNLGIEPLPDEATDSPPFNKTDDQDSAFTGLSLQKIEENEETPATAPSSESLVNPLQASRVNQKHTQDENNDYCHEIDDEKITPSAILAGGIAALLGAFIWKFVAVKFHYEIGYIAWGIGGAIGFAAAAAGSKGFKSGVACGILAMLAILGGKYMATASTMNYSLEALMEEAGVKKEEFRDTYNTEMEAAHAYQEITNEDSLKQFLVDYEYTDAETVNDVTQEDINYFEKESEPRLARLSRENTGFDQWYDMTFKNIDNTIRETSTFRLMLEDLGLIDAIFFFLGIGTAFRLGKGL